MRKLRPSLQFIVSLFACVFIWTCVIMGTMIEKVRKWFV